MIETDNSNLFSHMSFSSKQSISDKLFEEIKSMILSGKLAAGYSFPNENEMCQQLGVGRTTLREAYKSLETYGLITRTKRGTVVNDSSKILESMPLNVALALSDYNDLVEFRAMLDSQIAELAASRASSEQIEELEYCLEQMRSHRDDIEKLTIYDTRFHMTMAVSTGNKLIIRIMHMAEDEFSGGVYQAFGVDTERNIEQALESHSRILNAVRAHDSESARIAMYEHINNIRSRGNR